MEINMREVAEAITTKHDIPILLEDDYKTPATELSRMTTDSFIGPESFGSNFENFPSTIKTCMSGNTYIRHKFIDVDGEIVHTQDAMSVVEYTNSVLEKSLIDKMKFSDAIQDKVIVAVIWHVDKWGGSSVTEKMMLLSKPLTIREIYAKRREILDERTSKLKARNLSKIEMVWK